MELNITTILDTITPRDYSASVMELGQNAGAITWAHACDDALELFGDQFDRKEFDAYFAGFGAWSDDELSAHTDRESAALMLQFIAGDIRECEFQDWPAQFTDAWWEEYENASNIGTVSGRLFRCDDGTICYYVGE